MILALLCGTASAETTFGLHVASKHVPQRDQSNVNPGLYAITDSGWTVGGYRNSWRKLSVYAGKTWTLAEAGPVSLDLTLGAVTGYRTQKNKAGVRPLLLPSVVVGDEFRVRIAYGPRFDPKAGSHLVHLMVERSF
ncbi:hypothetical protein AAW51_2079 [Caldimonas brevitalea]|uniref:Uncharacterized protein n=1 Tax=Caldimonas brevitalea TaxID=413882 RepID=A0A0G3BQJ3_9BURK|nr:hypothetical protein AAW51_2079 [Caldimonas brevitalea]